MLIDEEFAYEILRFLKSGDFGFSTFKRIAIPNGTHSITYVIDKNFTFGYNDRIVGVYISGDDSFVSITERKLDLRDFDEFGLATFPDFYNITSKTDSEPLSNSNKLSGKSNYEEILDQFKDEIKRVFS